MKSLKSNIHLPDHRIGQKEQFAPSREGGYTIVESIIAMVVVGVLMTMVAPMIVFSTATRIQARRVELGTQAARAYIDWVRVDPATRAPSQTVSLAAGVTNFPDTVSVPATGDLTGNCTSNNDYCTNKTLYCVNFDDKAGCDKNSQRDMIVQGFRSVVTGTSGNPEDGYLLGVRVYRADAFQSGLTLISKQSTSAITSALGNRTAPLIALTTEMASKSVGYDKYCDRTSTKTNGGCGY
ncbi:MAG: hormogonium polysaccharide secretion pseudopilin HpsB [Microcoleaceae cyanobacterium]